MSAASEEALRDAVAAMLHSADVDDTHVLEHSFDGDGWSQPYSVRYSCWCGAWQLSWVQVDPEQSGRPDPADAVLSWHAHMERATLGAADQVFVPSTDQWWEPVEDDPTRYRTVVPCDDGCHHPVHAFGHPERLHHTEDAAWILANAVPATEVERPDRGDRR